MSNYGYNYHSNTYTIKYQSLSNNNIEAFGIEFNVGQPASTWGLSDTEMGNPRSIELYNVSLSLCVVAISNFGSSLYYPRVDSGRGVVILRGGNFLVKNTKQITANSAGAVYAKDQNGNQVSISWQPFGGKSYFYFYRYKKSGSSTYYYLPIFLEENVEKSRYSSSNLVSPSPAIFEPLQTIAFNNTPSIDITRTTSVVNTNAVGSSSTDTVTKYFNWESSYNTTGTKTAKVYYSSGVGVFSASIYISDWNSKVYDIVATGSQYDIYTGQTFGNDFLNAFKVRYKKTSNYGYVETFPETSLDLDKMSKKVLSESDGTSFTFAYDISGYTETSATSISYTISSNIHRLASNNAKFNAIQCKTSYELGDVIPNNGEMDFTNLGSLTYDDGTTISLADVTFLETPTITSGQISSLPHTVTIETTPVFTLTYTMNIQYFGLLTIDYSCQTEESAQVGNVVLSNAKTSFYPNEIIDYGSNAQLLVYNLEEDLIKTIARSDFNQYVVNVDNKYGTYANNYLVDGTIALKFTAYGIQLTQNIAVTYDEVKLNVNANNVVKTYIMNPETFTDFDYTGLVVKRRRHTNAVGSDVVISEVDISNDVTITHDTIDFTKGRTYAITITYTNEIGQTLTGSFDIFAEPLKAVRIEASDPTLDDTNDINFNGVLDSREYYNSNQDKFKYPSGIVLTVKYNDPTYDEPIQTLSNLQYYRDEEHTQSLSVNTSVIEQSDGNYIYFHDPYTGLDGRYSIYWLEDTIQQVSLVGTVNAYYGNKLSRLKQVVVGSGGLRCLHASGLYSTISNVNDFDFATTSIILNKPTSVSVIIPNVGTFELSNAETNFVWNNPHPKIVLNLTNFQTEYNNTVDIINPSGIMLTIEYYEDDTFETICDFSQACDYSSTATTDYSEFTVVGLGDLQNYAFNTPIIIEMEDVTEKTETIQARVYERFSASYISSDISIKIIEILTITGIKLIYAKTEYYVGEEFLDENDNTQIMIFYDDPQDNHRSYTCYLRSGLSALNIYPLKGTIFNTIQTGKVITITSATNYNVSVQYAIDVKANYVYDNSATHNLVALFLSDYMCPDEVTRTKYFLVERTITLNGQSVETTKINSSTGEREINDGIDVTDLEVLGYLEDIGDPSLNARVILFKDYISPIQGSNNVTVKFPCYVSGNADLINECKFGIMFGNNNAKNRLFLSGNENYINKDWHSSQVDSRFTDDETMLTGNYGYFEDTSECIYGETDNAVVGYDIVSNDKLLVLKTASDKETTVYFRQPQLVTAINNSGTAVTGLDDETLYQEEFSLTKGNNSVAGISPNAIANFNGDTLFISNEKQVVGLDLTGIIGDNQRYANTRSYYIDEDLKNQDLTKAFLWSNNKYLMLVLPNKIYIANFELKNNSQYEWFITDISNVSCVLERNNNIYFGTYDGKFYKMNSVYKDAKKIFAGYGVTRMSSDELNELLIARGYLADLDTTKDENGKPIKTYYFRPVPFTDLGADDDPYIYYSLGTIQNGRSADCDFYADNSTATNPNNLLELVCRKNGSTDKDIRNLILKRISEKVPVFFNGISSGSSVSCKTGSPFEEAIGKPYFLKEYEGDSTKHLYQVIDENGNVMPVSDIYNARICLRVTSELEMTNINKTDGTFQLLLDGEIINIVQYNSQSLVTVFRGEIIEYSNVEAFYITKPYDMGSLEYSKTVWSFTLANDTNIPSEIDLCYATNKIPYENMKTLANISKDVLGFDIETFNFAKVDFDKNIVPRTYTHKRVLSNVKFLCFGIRNYEDTNGVLSSMTITYTTPYPSYSGD